MYLCAEFIGDDLIGIEKENPIGSQRVVIKKPVALLWKLTIPYELHDFGAMCFGYSWRSIIAPRVDDVHLLESLKPFKAARKVAGFVFDRDYDSDWN